MQYDLFLPRVHADAPTCFKGEIFQSECAFYTLTFVLNWWVNIHSWPFILPKASSIEEESEPEYHQLFEYAFVVGLKEGKKRRGERGGGGRREEGEEGRVSMRRRKEA